MQLLVGVGVIITRNDRVLLGKRKGSHGASSWGLPGGHLEPGEFVSHCAKRETWEETGLVLQQVIQSGYTSDVFIEQEKHYITLFVEAQDPGGDPQLQEPDKCDAWQWFSWDQLPDNLFTPFQSYVDQNKLATSQVGK